jgi:hypothetical protein
MSSDPKFNGLSDGGVDPTTGSPESMVDARYEALSGTKLFARKAQRCRFQVLPLKREAAKTLRGTGGVNAIGSALGLEFACEARLLADGFY